MTTTTDYSSHTHKQHTTYSLLEMWNTLCKLVLGVVIITKLSFGPRVVVPR